MNAAAILALCASALQLGMALLLVGLARAPGWRAARTYAFIAITASAYSAANVFFAVLIFSDEVVLRASRVNYFVGALHISSWLMYTFGGPTASFFKMPRVLKSIAVVLCGTGTFILLFGTHAVPGEWNNTAIQWAGISYHSPVPYVWAEWYALILVATLLIPFVAFVQRARRGVEGSVPHLIGFTVFFVCMSVEVLVANGVINTFYMADVGFLAVVIPLVVATVRRVVADAGRLNALSQKLAGEVEERTEALDRAQMALLESERHAALGRLAAGVGHEINNPLTYLGLSLEAVDDWATSSAIPSDVREALESARDGTNRIRQVVDGLRNYTRSATGEQRMLKPEDLVRSALRVSAHQLQHSIHIATDFGETPSIYGVEAKLVQVLVNLITNAAQAINEAGMIDEVSITVITRSIDGKAVSIEVVDTGPGISAANVRLLAQPYFTTRAKSGGTGLGLFLARGIVEQHGGRFEISSELGSGTTVRIVLPAMDITPNVAPAISPESSPEGSAASLPATSTPAAPSGSTKGPTNGNRAPDLSSHEHGNDKRDDVEAVQIVAEQATSDRRLHVLIVDDEQLLGRVMARVLSPNCDVDIAESGDAALELLASGLRPDVVLCDLMMPGMSGIEFGEELALSNPSLRARTLFMTGGAVTAQATEFLERDDVRYINKPIGAQELLVAVRQVFADSTMAGGHKQAS